MFKAIFGIGALVIGALYVGSRVAREKLERKENPLSGL